MGSFVSGNKKAFSSFLRSRHRTLADLDWSYEDCGESIRADLSQLSQVAVTLEVPLSYLLRQFGADHIDLVDKVKICRRAGQFERLKMVGAQPAYIYRHVMKTTADQHLMVLRTSPMYGASDLATLNSGHRVKEIVYILSGCVGVRWSSKGVQRQDVLNEGDSIYIDSWVPHSFYSLTPDSQILAIDYSS